MRALRITWLLWVYWTTQCHARVNSSSRTAARLGQFHQATSRLTSSSVPAAGGFTDRAIHGPRKLLEGLDCDLELYRSFIDSTEGQDTFIMATMCESHIVYIKNVRAGGYGPVEQADLLVAMCSDECMKSDTLHQLALSRSRCSCAQVSANTFVKHDFCRENSARLLCTHLGECGHWGCELEDFMCLRYEWDKLHTCAGSALVVNAALLVACFVVLQLLFM